MAWRAADNARRYKSRGEADSPEFDLDDVVDLLSLQARRDAD